jgi:hypothetical protein
MSTTLPGPYSSPVVPYHSNPSSTANRYAYWAPYISTDPSGMGATYTAPSASNEGELGIRLTNTTDGGNGRINWSSSDIDWTKDFRMSAAVFINNTEPGITTGDGFILYAGATDVVDNIYGNESDNGLKFRLFTYSGAEAPLHVSGSSFWLGDTKGTQGRATCDISIGNWATYVVEVTTDRITNKRMAVAYKQNNLNYGGVPAHYGGHWPLAAMDVTSWEPTGTNFGFFCATGAAKENLYINSISFEAI